MRSKKYYVLIDGGVEKDTDLAVLINGEWHPKSVFHPDDDSDLLEGSYCDLRIARWYAIEKDLDYINQRL